MFGLTGDPAHGFFYPWLFARRGIVYDALHLFVDPRNGYRLSDAIWRTDVATRRAIDALLEYEIRQGTSAVDIAKQLEKFLQPERAGVRTKKPYGRWGSYDARRLARTEITAAAGRGVDAAAAANPFVDSIKWALSPSREQDWPCHCRANSERDSGMGPGVYKKGETPTYPDHPHCMCTKQPLVGQSTDEVVGALRKWLNEPSPQPFPVGTVGGGFGWMTALGGLLERLLLEWAAELVK